MQNIESKIYDLRGQKIMLDFDLVNCRFFEALTQGFTRKETTEIGTKF